MTLLKIILYTILVGQWQTQFTSKRYNFQTKISLWSLWNLQKQVKIRLNIGSSVCIKALPRHRKLISLDKAPGQQVTKLTLISYGPHHIPDGEREEKGKEHRGKNRTLKLYLLMGDKVPQRHLGQVNTFLRSKDSQIIIVKAQDHAFIIKYN